MKSDSNPISAESEAGRLYLPAGDFSSWLRHAREALITECGTEVECGECSACCSSSYFIHIRPEEAQTLGRIRKSLLVAAPGQPKGHLVLGYDRNGQCPLLKGGKCSIFEQRPITCRTYDCRVYAAAGILESEDGTSKISQRVRRWKFHYPTKLDLREHLAVQAAATFIRENAECFPGGHIPRNPGQLAILSLKVYELFLNKGDLRGRRGRASPNIETANAIVETCRQFDEMKQTRSQRA
jgi:Fe-S-cluster containining protein